MENPFSQYPYLREHFHFNHFNRMQEECLPVLMATSHNMIVSAPTATGKTVLFELALLKQYRLNPKFRAAYLAPIKSLCQQKTEEWKQAFRQLKVCEMTGDSLEEDTHDIQSANLIVATPEKLDSITRRNFAKSNFDLLMIDEVHMLSVQGRGACLEAVVTRIMTLNSKVRVVAASATIPNIQDLARWLKVPGEAVKTFGQEYRPIQLKRHVVGYPEHKSPYVFERILNSKLPDIITKYSEQKPALVFCQTQSGTIQACQMLINTISRDYFVTNDKQLTTLVTKSKQLSTEDLRQMIITGVVYHNASLSHRDRKIIQELFIAGYVKVICTTSTLSMGVNLPARLVVVKATTCYRGAGKGYEEYTKAEIQQMVGRAGRPQFQTEGTAVIMTTYSNVQRYQGDLKLEQLESQLLPQLKEHINTEIALRTCRNLDDVIDHIKRTFLFVRMLNCPGAYGIKNREAVQGFLITKCTETVSDLNQYEMIRFAADTKQLTPLEISVEVSKSYITVETAKRVIDNATQCNCLREFLMMLCQATEIGRYRSKLDERKHLKQLNQHIPIPLKETISTSQKKAFVLIQAHLQGLHIEDWELRKQARQICYFAKSLCYLAKKIFSSKKVFSGVYFCSWLINSLKVGAWQFKELDVIAQLPQLKKKVDWFKSSITSLDKLEKAIESKELSTLCRQPWSFSETVQTTLLNFKLPEVSVTFDGEFLNIEVVKLPKMNAQFKGLTVILGDRSNSLIASREVKYSEANSSEQNTVKFRMKSSTCPLYLVLLKQGIIGFDNIIQIDRTGKETVLTEINFVQKAEKPKRHTTSQKEVNAKEQDKRRNKSTSVVNASKQRSSIKSLTKISTQSESSEGSSNKSHINFQAFTKKQTNRKKGVISVKPTHRISRKVAIGEQPVAVPNFHHEQKASKPIESYMEKVDQFESRFSTNPKRLQSIAPPPKVVEPVATELKQPPTEQVFKPNIILTDCKKSAYEYFRNLMNF